MAGVSLDLFSSVYNDTKANQSQIYGAMGPVIVVTASAVYTGDKDEEESSFIQSMGSRVFMPQIWQTKCSVYTQTSLRDQASTE